MIHLAPLFICYLLGLDFLLYSQTDFISWVIGSGVTSWRLAISEYIIFLQAFFYSGMTAVLVKRYQREAHSKLANFNPSKFKWLWGFVVIGFCIWCLKALLSFTSNMPIALIYIADILIVALIYFVAMAQWKTPQLFTINQLQADESAENKESTVQESGSEGALDIDTKASMFNAVKDQIEKHDLYRDSELTLASLATATGLSTHHLSEVLNQYEGQNFYQFINSYRIADVCEKFDQQTSGKIMDIAMDAGFASKSTFNSIFKKFVGTTPSEYRRNLTT